MTNKTVVPSPLPIHTKPHSQPAKTSDAEPSLPKPKLRLHLQDARHAAAASFFRFIPDLEAVLNSALAAIVDQLYIPSSSSSNKHKAPASFTPTIPPTRSVTIILEDFNGVAYTTGTDLDNDHKEIHFSLSYINHVINTNSDALSELKGVLTHELVHCYQHTAPPPASSKDKDIPHPPGGLIEGIADFVRLKAGLVPPHWKKPTNSKERAEKWDAGYQNTAFFLEWLEDERGRGTVGLVNDRLLTRGYVGEEEGDTDGKGFWRGLFGVGVKELWEEYGRYLDR
ncbi:PBSP domain protein [Talaromyces proteolyticus]|uniref:PBSP domain protein n=1 Tax=Talaromyces proteolyticus TaxID=1131652 RepID=A0AAD4Q1F3_9EURO|nr:PBSP domain protein [Talaromyces proteolyticus]KAH8698415.1 PBSP domain protein [Talaromyces proteolyticus]